MTNVRRYWIFLLRKICEKPLELCASDRLKELMPIEGKRSKEREKFAPLELLGRILCGLSPFLELNKKAVNTDLEEKRIASWLSELAIKSLRVATDLGCRSYMNFREGKQPLVDSAFLVEGILRAPKALWEDLDPSTKERLIKELKETRRIEPYYSNWLLFSAIIETFFFFVGEEWDSTKIDLILKIVEGWYKGDGVYGDGPHFRWDYYNSFVIQPMLIDVLRILSERKSEWKELYTKVLKRAQRYALVLERMISPEGTFPIIGRSITYRTGVFHLLSQLSLLHLLPPELNPAQVRCALTTVLRRIFEHPATFDENGWLKIGLVGSQPSLGEEYITTGSLYLCTTVFLPLGLPPSDPFWKDPCESWTNKKVWEGEDIHPDKALED
ncbi:hypothetical protein ACMTAS_1111 [Thermotoga neapolitana DSM 4359]|nr:hypothetical protein TRQ7_09020 [Thermotoga sp. RQ7]KFZ21299.1 hypothetical protein LA10_07969 [Thermotoga neapolitana LA10]HBF10253.1 DUF2264 domain-containing protein [Thermotoga neapolitana]